MSITIYILKTYKTEESSVFVTIPPVVKAEAEADGRSVGFDDVRVIGETGAEVGANIADMISDYEAYLTSNSGA